MGATGGQTFRHVCEGVSRLHLTILVGSLWWFGKKCPLQAQVFMLLVPSWWSRVGRFRILEEVEARRRKYVTGDGP